MKEEKRKSRFEPIDQGPDIPGASHKAPVDESASVKGPLVGPLSQEPPINAAPVDPPQVTVTNEAPVHEDKEEGEIVDENQIEPFAKMASEGNHENEQLKSIKDMKTVTAESTEKPKEQTSPEVAS